ncbi:alanine racemase [uncultured Microbacterium sp.]|uniref:alanine racemase n=1 Tax=uncultured Microbacterium sp. TaxID=191216 RepID=UPI0026030095|nr:alanine racemase [uncultured Microbacterium sp.]
MGPALHLSTRTFAANIEAVRARIAPSQLLLVMKDDAYGHGLSWAVPAALTAGVSWFGSYDIAAGLRIRELSSDAPARIFSWATSTPDEVEHALEASLDLGVGTVDYLALIVEASRRTGSVARVHLKIDTGLNRNGVRREDWGEFVSAARAAERSGAIRISGVWSHLSEASDDEDDASQQIFLDSIDAIESSGPALEHRHLTASAASWWRPELRGTLSRIGAFCYGIRSADGPDLDGIRPAARLSASVLEIRADHVVIDLGSFDGVPSSLAGSKVGTPAGPRAMSALGPMTSQVEAWPGAEIGDEVWIFGSGENGEDTATALAESIDTVGEEMITRLTSRVRRVIED